MARMYCSGCACVEVEICQTGGEIEHSGKRALCSLNHATASTQTDAARDRPASHRAALQAAYDPPPAARPGCAAKINQVIATVASPHARCSIQNALCSSG